MPEVVNGVLFGLALAPAFIFRHGVLELAGLVGIGAPSHIEHTLGGVDPEQRLPTLGDMPDSASVFVEHRSGEGQIPPVAMTSIEQYRIPAFGLEAEQRHRTRRRRDLGGDGGGDGDIGGQSLQVQGDAIVTISL